MTLQICSYEGCYQQRFPCSSITFFQLPTDEPRRTQWIQNSGNKQLLNLKSSQKRYFCEVHFQKKDIKPHFYRKLLYKSAVPLPYVADDGSTPTTTTNTIQYTEFEVVRDGQFKEEGTTHDNLYQEFEINEGEYEHDEEAQQTISTDDCILYDDCNEHNLQKNKLMTEEFLDIHENIAEHAEVIPIKQECESFNVNDYIDTSDVDATLSTSCMSPSTSCISPSATSSADVIHSSETQNDDTTSERNAAAAVTTHLVLNSDKENSNDLNETAVSDKSYESDKHFALSLVYYFQRLNAKKKAQAKIDILTYLVALEQAKDA